MLITQELSPVWHRTCSPLAEVLLPFLGAGGGFPREAKEASILTGTTQLTGTKECDYSVGGEELLVFYSKFQRKMQL